MAKYGSLSLKLKEKGISLSEISEIQERELKRAVEGVAVNAFDEIVRKANAELTTSLTSYTSSLNFDRVGDLYIISIAEPGRHFEDGFDGFDEIRGLINGPKSKISKDGKRYNIVPYQHRPTAKSTMKTREGYKQQQSLNRAVKRMVKVPPRPIKDRSGRVVGHIVKEMNKELMPNKGGNIYAGMVKVEKQYNKAKQNTYLTFRGVSENSDPTDWQHPGYKGLHAFEHVEKIIEQNLESIVEGIFGV